MVVAAVVSAPDDPVQQIQRYCATSWLRAGIAYQDWEDCTQDAITELLSRIGASQLATAITEPQSAARRELKRCVWCIIKRYERANRSAASLPDTLADARGRSSQFPYTWDELLEEACHIVSAQQQQILILYREGWQIPEIAATLQVGTLRVSGNKYKAVRRLRNELVETEQFS
jgi:DNA-directed RNA polymerase specialized sigma24 family protein